MALRPGVSNKLLLKAPKQPSHKTPYHAFIFRISKNSQRRVDEGILCLGIASQEHEVGLVLGPIIMRSIVHLRCKTATILHHIGPIHASGKVVIEKNLFSIKLGLRQEKGGVSRKIVGKRFVE